MKGNNNILIVVGALFLVALGWFGLGGGWGADESFDEEYADWTYELGFNPSDKSPYGTYVLRELMDSGLAEVKLKLIETHLDLDKIGNKDGIYMFIGHENYMNQANIEKLLECVSKGNQAFLSFHEIPDYIEHALFEDFMFLM